MGFKFVKGMFRADLWHDAFDVLHQVLKLPIRINLFAYQGRSIVDQSELFQATNKTTQLVDKLPSRRLWCKLGFGRNHFILCAIIICIWRFTLKPFSVINRFVATEALHDIVYVIVCYNNQLNNRSPFNNWWSWQNYEWWQLVSIA